MRILFLSNLYPPWELGGYEQWCQEVATHLVDRGHDVSVLTSRHGVQSACENGVPYVTRTLHLQTNIAYYRPIDFFLWRPFQERDNIQTLRKKFPQLPIALVSHGQEQFSLLSQHETKYAKTHSLTRQLVVDDVEVHVCGTHASWYSFSEEDYPDFLDVAPAAPAQINDYIKLGYIHVEL